MKILQEASNSKKTEHHESGQLRWLVFILACLFWLLIYLLATGYFMMGKGYSLGWINFIMGIGFGFIALRFGWRNRRSLNDGVAIIFSIFALSISNYLAIDFFIWGNAQSLSTTPLQDTANALYRITISRWIESIYGLLEYGSVYDILWILMTVGGVIYISTKFRKNDAIAKKIETKRRIKRRFD